MKTKSILYLCLLIIGLALSLGVVCASENMTDTPSLGAYETPSEEISSFESNDLISISNQDSMESDVMSVPKLSNPKVPEPCHPKVPEIDTPSNGTNFVVVFKNWEGNYSGGIDEIEVQLLKKLNPGNDGSNPSDQKCPPKWKASPSDLELGNNEETSDSNLLSDSIGDLFILPDANGVLTTYVLVQTAKLTKEKNWRHAFKNLTFSSAYRNSTGDWILGDSGEYIVREIVPKNSELVSSHFIKYFTCPVDNGLKVFWNLTNRVIPNETTNKTPEENKTVNKTEEFKIDEPVSAYGRGPEPSKNETSTDSPKEPSISDVDVSKSATGNPIFIILIALFAMIIPLLRKKQ